MASGKSGLDSLLSTSQGTTLLNHSDEQSGALALRKPPPATTFTQKTRLPVSVMLWPSLRPKALCICWDAFQPRRCRFLLCACADAACSSTTDLRALPVRRSMPFALLLITGTFLAPLSLPCFSLAGAGTLKSTFNNKENGISEIFWCV